MAISPVLDKCFFQLSYHRGETEWPAVDVIIPAPFFEQVLSLLHSNPRMISIRSEWLSYLSTANFSNTSMQSIFNESSISTISFTIILEAPSLV